MPARKEVAVNRAAGYEGHRVFGTDAFSLLHRTTFIFLLVTGADHRASPELVQQTVNRNSNLVFLDMR